MNCPNCGIEINDDMAFCPECGVKLNEAPQEQSYEETTVQAEPEVQPEPEVQAEPEYYQPQPEYYQQPQYYQPEPQYYQAPPQYQPLPQQQYIPPVQQPVNNESSVLGILSIVFACIPAMRLIGLIIGLVGKNSNKKPENQKLCKIGAILSGVFIAIEVICYILYIVLFVGIFALSEMY